jgi:hypothetical protein
MRSGYERIGRTVKLAVAQRSCLDKRRYSSRNDARDAAAKHQVRLVGSADQRPYRCTLCGGFHLATIKPKNTNRRAPR